MNLSEEEKELLARAFTCYYKKQIWGEMCKEDNAKASDEDYKVRHLAMKLGFREKFPNEIIMGW